MWLPYKLSHLTSSRGARNDASKIEHTKKQQPENTAKNNQIFWAAVITHMQDARHPIHRVRIPHSKFHQKRVAMSMKVAWTLTRYFSLSNEWRQKAIDAHACVVVSKLYDVTNTQTKKTRAHFSRVSFGEILWKFVCFMTKMPISQYNFLRKFYLRIFFKSKIWNCTILENPLDKFSIFSN